ncbi:PAS domain S-box protein [Haloterrigena salinisoli]|uniref:PAS domain S-box protein n=1 Tax=Haloterrigena salinisoli TaxID=3132747 RepID=UPI0030CD3C19
MGSETEVVYVCPDGADGTVRELRERVGRVTTVDAVADRPTALSSADCVVVGDGLSDTDPIECCRRLRAYRPELPVVVFPTDGSESLAGAAVAAGADGYVPRADGVDTLATRLDALLEDDDTASSTAVTPSASGSTTDLSDRLELLIDQSPLAIIEWSLDFDVACWNPAATELFGYAASEARGRSATELIVPADVRGEVLEHWEQLLDGDFDGNTAWRVNENVRKDGTTITCEWVNTPLTDDDGEIVGVLSFVQDVTPERKRANALEALQETTRELMRARSADEIAAIVTDATEHVIDRPLAAVRIRDEDREALELAAISETLDEVTGDISSIGPDGGALWQIYEDGEPFVIEDVRTELIPYEIGVAVSNAVLYPLGDHGLLSVAPADDADFDLAEIHLTHVLAATAEAALDRLAFEEQLRAERDRFAALFENVPDAVVSARQTADEAIVEAVNPAFERMFGYDESAIVGRPLDRIIVPANRTAEAETFTRRGGNGETIETEVKRRTADGLRDFMMRVVPVDRGESTDHTFGLYTDITDRKQRQKRVEILNRVLRHDMRNGMNIIDGCAEMLADAVDDDDIEYATTIQERAGELVSLAEKTRAVERVLERESVTTGPIDVTETIEEALDRLETDYPGVTVTRSVPDRLFARIDASLRTALYQVLENAVEHHDRSAPTIDVSVCDRRDDGMLSLSIADDGPGMPDEERELLQGDREITQLRHASGLGLWLVNLVVTQAGGQLTFDANEPRGTVVTLEIPRADAELARSTGDSTVTSDY